MSQLRATARALQSPGGLRRVLAAYGLYDLVEFAAWMAVMLWAFDRGGAALAGLVAVVQLLPAALLAPALAGYGDRIPRGTALVVAHASVALAAALTTLAIVVAAPVPLVVLASGLLTTGVAVVRPIHFAALPQLARTPGDLVSANSLSSVADGVALFAGPALAGVGVAVAGPGFVFGASTVAALVAALLCVRLGLAAGVGTDDEDEPEGWRAALEGLNTLRGDWGALALLLVMATDFVITGALDVLGVAYSQDVLDQGQTGAGLLVGAVGLGSLIGAVVGGALATRRRLGPVVVTAALVQGLAFAMVSQLVQLGPAFVVIMTVGVASALMLVSGRTLLQRATDDRVLARVFAVQEGTSLLGLALGAGLVPVLIDRSSAAGAFVPIGLGTVTLALFGALFVRRLDDRAVLHPAEMALLRGVPFLAVLPPYELERLSQAAGWREVPQGYVVVRQGDPGDDFFVIDEGAFEVTVDGVARPTTMGHGTGFGEIALLHAVPRTATVTASTPGRLLVVGAGDFLAAVTGSADGQALVREVTASHLARDAERPT